MATATVVNSWKDSNNAYLAVYVDEGGVTGRVEYIGNTPLVDAQGVTKTQAQLKTDLVAIIKAQRNTQMGTIGNIPITGTITV